MELIVTVFLGLLSAACFLCGWYFIQQTKLKERILLAEKGIDINTLFPKKNKSNLWLKIGIVILCAFSGLLLALIITSFIHTLPEKDICMTSLILFAGIGMVIAHYVDKPKEQN